MNDITKIEPTSRVITKQGKDSSFLVQETRSMDNNRRLAEQEGERAVARVRARERKEDSFGSIPEEAPDNGLLAHPYMDKQLYDGVDPNLNPEPPLNTEARREYDNEQREQEKEKQYRLGNMPKFNSAPTPRKF